MILTITGSDSTGGSGVQADIRTISELGGYAVSAITSITVQNTLGIQEFFDIPAEIVSGQIEAIMNDMQPDIVKIGMIRRVETLNVVIDALTKYRPCPYHLCPCHLVEPGRCADDGRCGEPDKIPSAAALFCRRVTQEGERHHSAEFQAAEPCREAGTPDLSPRQCQFAWSHQPFFFSSCRLSESGQEDGGGVGDGAGFHQCRTRAPEQSAGQKFRALQPVYLAG